MTEETFLYKEHTYPIRFVRKKSAARYILKVKSLEVYVTLPPRGTLKVARELILKHRRWVEEQLDIHSSLPKPPCFTNTTQQVYLFGEKYQVALSNIDHSLTSKKYSFQVCSIDKKVTLFHTAYNSGSKALAHCFESWYKEILSTLINELLEKIDQSLKKGYKKFSLRKQRTLWGSCSSTGTLSFNLALALLPKDVIEYVVIHELCHLTHRNHSSSFWNLVAQYCPEYQKHEDFLRRSVWAIDYMRKFLL